MAATHLHKNDIWRVRHSRKGNLTVKLLEDVNTESDGFFSAEIVDGTARFVSDAYRASQATDGLGTPGTTLAFRTSLTCFVEQVQP